MWPRWEVEPRCAAQRAALGRQRRYGRHVSIYLAAATADQSPGILLLLVLIIGVPIALAVLITLIVLGPKWSRAGRWRPGQSWNNAPMWFGDGDPVAVDKVIQGTSPRELSVSAAAGDADGLSIAEESVVEEVQPVSDGQPSTPLILGGARGRW